MNKFRLVTTLSLSVIAISGCLLASSCKNNSSDYVGNWSGTNWKGYIYGEILCENDIDGNATIHEAPNHTGYSAHNLVIPNKVKLKDGSTQPLKCIDGGFSLSWLTGTIKFCDNLIKIAGPLGERGGSAQPDLIGNLIIPNSVITIGDNVFNGCNGFSGSLTIPDSVTSVGDNAFSGCSGFSGDLIMSKSINLIGTNAFKNCSGFFSDNWNDNNKISHDDNNVYYLRNDNDYYCLGYFANVKDNGDKPSGNLTILSGTKIICGSAFCCDVYGDSLSLFGTLNMPDTIKSICSYAFTSASLAQPSMFTSQLLIPNGVKFIGAFAFWECNFDSILINNSVTECQDDAFYNCEGVDTLTFNNFDNQPNWSGVDIFTNLGNPYVTNKRIYSTGSWPVGDGTIDGAWWYAKQKGLPNTGWTT